MVNSRKRTNAGYKQMNLLVRGQGLEERQLKIKTNPETKEFENFTFRQMQYCVVRIISVISV